MEAVKKAMITDISEPESNTEIERIRRKVTSPAPKSAKKEILQFKPFAMLGPLEPLLVAVFAGVEFPVKTKAELILKAGGPDRLLRIPTSKTVLVYALEDVVNAWPEIERFFPMTSPENIASELAQVELRYRREHKPLPFMRISSERLTEVLNQPIGVGTESFSTTFKPDVFVTYPELFFNPELFFKPELFQTERKFGIKPEFLKEVAPENRDLFFKPELKQVPTHTLATPENIFMKELLAEENLEILKGLPENQYKVFERYLQTMVSKVMVEHERLATELQNKLEKQLQNINELYTKATAEVVKLGESEKYIVAEEVLAKVSMLAYKIFAALKEAKILAWTCMTHATAVPGERKTNEILRSLEVCWPELRKNEYLAVNLVKKAREIAAIPVIPVYGHVVEADPIFRRDVPNADITVRYLAMPEIPVKTVVTNAEGRFVVYGHFGVSPTIGPAHLLLTCMIGKEVINQEVVITSDSPSIVEFEHIPVLE